MKIKTTALALAAALLAGPPALADMTVPMDQSRRLTLNAAAADVMIGNPSIAAVSMIDSRNLFVMGRGYGVTNLIVLDHAGRTVWSPYHVTPPDTAQVSRFRAAGAQRLLAAREAPHAVRSQGVFERRSSPSRLQLRAAAGAAAAARAAAADAEAERPRPKPRLVPAAAAAG